MAGPDRVTQTTNATADWKSGSPVQVFSPGTELTAVALGVHWGSAPCETSEALQIIDLNEPGTGLSLMRYSSAAGDVNRAQWHGEQDCIFPISDPGQRNGRRAPIPLRLQHSPSWLGAVDPFLPLNRQPARAFAIGPPLLLDHEIAGTNTRVRRFR